MALDRDAVAKVANLCRLEIEEEELAPMAEELSHILSWIEQLQEVDVSSRLPMSTAFWCRRIQKKRETDT